MSSGSESDEDYMPGEPEQVSEEDSADEETDIQYEKEAENKSSKRKLHQSSKGKKKIKTKNGIIETDHTSTEKAIEGDPVKFPPEEEKQKEDDLWAKFLEGTDTKPKLTSKENNSESAKTLDKSQEHNHKDIITNNVKEDDKERERRIFEFAGETIVVENNVIKEKIKTSDDAATVSKLDGPSRSRGGGLSNVLGQLHKKNKLSTLEKSKLDWDTFKKEENIEDEILSHNKGKSGFLDRRDFLERTDVRQYEIERDLRMSKRSNR